MIWANGLLLLAALCVLLVQAKPISAQCGCNPEGSGSYGDENGDQIGSGRDHTGGTEDWQTGDHSDNNGDWQTGDQTDWQTDDQTGGTEDWQTGDQTGDNGSWQRRKRYPIFPRGRRGLNPNNTGSKLPRGAIRVGDEILMPKDILLRKSGKFRNAQSNAEWLWPQGKLNYVFSDGYPEHLKSGVRSELAIFNREMAGCVQFVEGRPNREYVVKVSAEDGGCGSLVGRIGMQEGFQEIYLPEVCVQSKGTVQHEFMHALGFEHEHSRKDREQHIQLNWKNMMEGSCAQFDVCKSCLLSTPYDVNSIMHYASDAFTCHHERETMVTKQGNKIPRNERLSELDKKKIRTLYKCSK